MYAVTVGDRVDTVGVLDGGGVMLDINTGKGVLISLVAFNELVHEDKISRDRQSKLLMKNRFLNLLIWK